MRPHPRAFLKRAERKLLPQPDDLARTWRGSAAPGAPALRIQRYGGCEWRDMPLAHTLTSEPGYPRHLARSLAARDIALEFSDRYTATADDLPRTDADLQRFVKLTAPPDLALVQINGLCAYRTLLGLGSRRGRARDAVGRRLGPHVHAAYRVADPIFRLGRCVTPEPDPANFESFVDVVAARWPQTRILVLGMLPGLSNGAFDPRAMRRISEVMLDHASSMGLDVLDLDGVIPADRSFYCANGAQLGPRGGALVARALEDWLDARAMLARPRDASVEPWCAGGISQRARRVA